MFTKSQTGSKLKILRSDNGGEFTSKEFEEFLKSYGSQHQKLTPYSPQQNGVVEWMN